MRKLTEEDCGPYAANERKIANCDQEAWVKARIHTAIRMALAIRFVHLVSADDFLEEGGIEGVVNGAAVEIIRTLGLEPEYKNLRKPGVLKALDPQPANATCAHKRAEGVKSA